MEPIDTDDSQAELLPDGVSTAPTPLNCAELAQVSGGGSTAYHIDDANSGGPGY